MFHSFININLKVIFETNFTIQTEQWPNQLDEAGSYVVLDKFAELGGNFIDTANVYTWGKSEQIIGNWLKK